MTKCIQDPKRHVTRSVDKLLQNNKKKKKET